MKSNTIRQIFKKFYASKSRAKERGVINDFSFDEWIMLLLNTEGRCNKCNKYFGIEDLELHHIIAVKDVIKGFKYKIDDVEFLCLKCHKTEHLNSR